jgi:hypothetical protein
MAMLKQTMIGTLLASVVVIALTHDVRAQDDRIPKLEQRVKALERRIADDEGLGSSVESYLAPALTLLGIGLFCGLWARSTGRDFWLWLVAGAIFNIFALFAVWVKHEEDKAARRAAEKPSKEAMEL